MLRRGLLHGPSLGGAKSEPVVWEFHLQNMRNHKALYKEWSTRSSEAAKTDPCVRDYLRASVRYNCHIVSRINGVAKEGQIGGHIAAYCYKLQNQKQTYFYQKNIKNKVQYIGDGAGTQTGGSERVRGGGYIGALRMGVYFDLHTKTRITRRLSPSRGFPLATK